MSGLPQVIAGHGEASADSYKDDIAAALYAVNGNITTAPHLVPLTVDGLIYASSMVSPVAVHEISVLLPA